MWHLFLLNTMNGYWIRFRPSQIQLSTALFICYHTPYIICTPIVFRIFNSKILYSNLDLPLYSLTLPEFQIAGHICISQSLESDPRNHWTVHHQTWMTMVVHICNYSWMGPPFTTALFLGVSCQWNCGTHYPTSSKHGSTTTLVEL